jgi:hypothetical protein
MYTIIIYVFEISLQYSKTASSMWLISTLSMIGISCTFSHGKKVLSPPFPISNVSSDSWKMRKAPFSPPSCTLELPLGWIEEQLNVLCHKGIVQPFLVLIIQHFCIFNDIRYSYQVWVCKFLLVLDAVLTYICGPTSHHLQNCVHLLHNLVH